MPFDSKTGELLEVGLREDLHNSVPFVELPSDTQMVLQHSWIKQDVLHANASMCRSEASPTPQAAYVCILHLVPPAANVEVSSTRYLLLKMWNI